MTVFDRVKDGASPTPHQYRFEYHHRYSDDSLVFLTGEEPDVRSAIGRLIESEADKNICIDRITETGTL